MMPFEFQRLEIPDVLLVRVMGANDARGFFREVYRREEFIAQGIPPFVQDNHSHSRRGVLRGLHYQKHPKAQGKFVTVIRGEIFDVAVDLRQGSPTYARWLAQILSAENGCALYIPPGFAHGFSVLSDSADVLYKVTAEYAPDLDRGIRWNDPDLAIDWRVRDPIVSSKDAQLPFLREADNNFVFPLRE
jgi:dTDP-4-dehydrorhamnose 3,5-epimerase